MNKNILGVIVKKLLFMFLIGMAICWNVSDAYAELIELPCYSHFSYEDVSANIAGSDVITRLLNNITAGKDEYTIQQLSFSGAVTPNNFKIFPLADGIRGFSTQEQVVPGDKAVYLEISSIELVPVLFRGCITYNPSNLGKDLDLIFNNPGTYTQHYDRIFVPECVDSHYFDTNNNNYVFKFKDITGDGKADAIFSDKIRIRPDPGGGVYNEGYGFIRNGAVSVGASNVPVGYSAKRPLGISLYFDSSYLTGIDIDTFTATKAAKAAAEAAATAAAEASATATAVAESAKVTNAPLITQFQVNGGALEKEGTDSVTTGIRAQNSPTDTDYNKIQYRIIRVNSDGTASSLVAWTNFTSNSTNPSITPVAGINNIVLYVKNTTSGAISKANTTLIAGTAAEREAALQSYYGGMYGIAKASKDAADSARTAVGDLLLQNAWNFNIMGSVLGYILNDILIEITQFQVNDGALEKEGTGDVRASFRVRENNELDMSFTIKRVTTDGTEIELIPWTQLSSSNKVVDVPTIAGINNYILYIKDNDSNATSKATATVIAGTAAQREAALKSYYGGMYGELKDGTYGLSALKSLIDTVNGVAGQAKTAAVNAKTEASNAYRAVATGTGLKTIDVLTDPNANKGLIKTYDKANVAATNASAAATNSSTAASSANTAASRALTTINNTQANDGGTTKSAATLAKEAKDNAGTAVTQLTSDTAGTIRADLTTTKSDASTAKTQAAAAADRVWDATEGKSAATLAKEARDKVNEVSTVVNTMSQAITPIIHSVKGQNGATCTTGTTFIVVTSASNATQYRARLSGGSWTSWGSNNTITVSVGSSTGPKTIEVQAKSSTGAIATDSITIFKI